MGFAKLSRRAVLGTGMAAMTPGMLRATLAADAPMLTRPIPKTREMLPAVGLGTAVRFENPLHYAGNADHAGMDGLSAAITALLANGGTVIDTAPPYNAEAVIADTLAAVKPQKLFLASKLFKFRTMPLADEARDEMAKLKVDKLDLLQLQQVTDGAQSLDGLKALKAQGLTRYIGATNTTQPNGPKNFEALEAIMRREKPDFVEFDYNIGMRDAEARLLPLAMDSGIAVLVAMPFGEGASFGAVLKKPLPDFAAEIDCTSWAQFFLKFILSHPAVTVAIPGTSSAAHMIDDLAGARGRLPDKKMRERMAQYVAAV